MFNTTPFNPPFVRKTWYEKSISEFCESSEGFTLLGLCNAASGLDYSSLERYIVRDNVGLLKPFFGSTVQTSIGISVGTIAGTAEAQSYALTNIVTRYPRIGYKTSSAAAGSVSGLRQNVRDTSIGSGTYGGFTWVGMWVCEDAATVAGARQFCGITSLTTAFTNAEPSSLTDVIGFGHGASDTNLKVYGAGSSGQVVDLSASFPANTLSSDLYRGCIFSFKELNNKIGWQIKNLTTGAVARGILSAETPGVQLPASTTLMSPYQFWRCNNATALETKISVVNLYRGLSDV